MNSNQRDRYLGLLGLSKRPPNLDFLQEIVRAQMQCVPFENISKLHYLQHFGLVTIPDLEQYLDGIEFFHFGGTCYTNNYYFFRLLAVLGFHAALCGADMTNPDVHVVSFVEVDGSQYLVDVGYAAPFTKPLPRDLKTDYPIELGRDRYVLKPQDSLGRSRIDMYRNGKLRHGYLAKPLPRQISDFEPAIRSSFSDGATFMNALLVAGFSPGRSLVIHNLTLIESLGEHFTTRMLESRDELVETIYKHFGIPSEISQDVLAGLDLSGDAWN